MVLTLLQTCVRDVSLFSSGLLTPFHRLTASESPICVLS